MATANNTVPQLSPGERAPNVFLPDQRDLIISLHDKSRGEPIFVLLYPTQKDPRCADELERLFALAPQMLAEGAHLFAIGGDPVALVQKLAAQHQTDVFLMADAEHKAAGAFGARGKLLGFVLDPAQRVQKVLTPDSTPIADRAAGELLALKRRPPFHPGLHPPLLTIPQALPREFCRYLIEQFNVRGNEASGTLRMTEGKMVFADDGTVKRRRDHHVQERDLLEQITAYIERRVIPEIHRAFHCPVRYVEGFKIVRYDSDSGGYFRPHRDNTTPSTLHRRFAMTLNLNTEEYQGGELRFPEFDNATYSPATGEAVIFSCDLLHEVTDMREGQRYVLLSFLYDEIGHRRLEQYRRMMPAPQKQA